MGDVNDSSYNGRGNLDNLEKRGDCENVEGSSDSLYSGSSSPIFTPSKYFPCNLARFNQRMRERLERMRR
jgi:hypothetical protein